jgi:hypothetical protein
MATNKGRKEKGKLDLFSGENHSKTCLTTAEGVTRARAVLEGIPSHQMTVSTQFNEAKRKNRGPGAKGTVPAVHPLRMNPRRYHPEIFLVLQNFRVANRQA